MPWPMKALHRYRRRFERAYMSSPMVCRRNWSALRLLPKLGASPAEKRACEGDRVEVGLQVLQVESEVEDVDVGDGLCHLQGAAT